MFSHRTTNQTALFTLDKTLPIFFYSFCCRKFDVICSVDAKRSVSPFQLISSYAPQIKTFKRRAQSRNSQTGFLSIAFFLWRRSLYDSFRRFFLSESEIFMERTQQPVPPSIQRWSPCLRLKAFSVTKYPVADFCVVHWKISVATCRRF